MREIVTPEGVPLRIELAGRGDRFGAVLLDIVIIGIAVQIVALGLSALFRLSDDGEWVVTVYVLISFLIRAGYFMIFELKWQGRTPGKAALGIRVIDRYGGRLTTEAIVTRNALREIELFLPISLALSLAYSAFFAASDQAVFVLALTVWAFVFTLMPVFNRDRMRCGDIVAGTLVVKMPKPKLLSDLSGGASVSKADGQPSGSPFTEAQLKVYGIYELQTLERVLRSDRKDTARLQSEVTRRIKRKIKWTGPVMSDPEFLQAFYSALRRHLEGKMLFGIRREDKHDSAGR